MTDPHSEQPAGGPGQGYGHYGYPPPGQQVPESGAPGQQYGYDPSYQQQPWYGYGQPVYVQPPPTNGLAIASMVLGILWIYWLGSILALIFGYIALKNIKATGQSGRGMAIAGVVLGYVWIGLLAIGLAIAGIAALVQSLQ